MASLAVLRLGLAVSVVVVGGCATSPPATGARLAIARGPAQLPEQPPEVPAARPEEPPATEPAAGTTAQRAAAERLVERAQAMLSAGRPGDAADALERAVAVDPSFAGAWIGLARLHLAEGDHDTALAFCERAAMLAAGDGTTLAEVATLQGRALEAAGRYVAARDAYVRALVLAPDYPAARDGLDRVTALGQSAD